MKTTDNRPKDAAALRQRAEEIARENVDQLPENIAAMSLDETQRLLHELRVHQIELELQNEELRRVQLELQASQTQYFDLYDLAPVGYVTLSEQGLILQANLAAAVLLGVSRGQLVKQPLARFFVPEAADTDYLRRKQLLATGASQAYELQLKKNDGPALWAHLVVTAVDDAADQAAFRVVLTDVTERKRVEAELRESEARRREQAVLLESETLFRSVLNSMRANIAVLDRQGTIRTINEAWAQFALQNGAEPTRPRMGVGVNYLAVCESVGEEARPIWQGLRGVLSRAQDTFTCEYCCDSPSEPRWFIMHASSLPEGQGGAVVVHTDITDRKQAEDRLRESEGRFRMMADCAPVLIWMSDEKQLCTYLNRPWLEFTGRTMAQELGHGWAEGVHPEDLPGCLETYDAAFAARKPFTMKYRLRRKDGEFRWILDNGVPRFGPDGVFTG